MVSDVVGQGMLVVLARTLFDLLKDVYREYARLMLAFAAAGAVIERVPLDPIAASKHQRPEG